MSRSSLPRRAAELMARIDDRTALVGIIGLGYVGLPLALTFAERGFRVLGFDVDPKKVDALAGARCTSSTSTAARLSAALDAGRLRRHERLRAPRRARRDPHLRADAADPAARAGHELRGRHSRSACARRLRPGQLVVLESTTYPGTTDELVRGILEESGLRCGRDFFLAFSPEREDPGNASFGTATIPKVVGGVDAACGDLAQGLYDRSSPGPSASRRPHRRGDQARREHLPRRQHRPRQRAQDRLRPDGHRHLGGARRGLDQALRLHALQPGPRLGRPLHPARPVLPVLEGARVRGHPEVHRARRRGQRADAATTSSRSCRTPSTIAARP